MELKETIMTSVTAVFLSVLVLSGGITGISAQSSDISPLPGETNTGETTSENSTTVGGNVTQVNVSSKPVTSKWGAFFGHINGENVLGNKANNALFSWTVTNPADSIAYAVPSESSPPDGSMSAVSNPNEFLGSEFDFGPDSANNTFNNTDRFTGEDLNFTTASAYTFVNSSFDPSGRFKTFLLDDGSAGESPIYAAEAVDNKTSYESTEVDYQLIVGLGESPDSKTFDFFAELS